MFPAIAGVIRIRIRYSLMVNIYPRILRGFYYSIFIVLTSVEIPCWKRYHENVKRRYSFILMMD